MACDEDFTFGYGIDDVLHDLLEKMPYFREDPSQMIAALIALDTHFGLRGDGDYILLSPMLAMWLGPEVVTFTDPEVNAALAAVDEEQIERVTSERPFQVEFTSPEGEQYTAAFPEIVRGKSVLLRVMNDLEAEKLGSAYTVRGDGTFIYRPEFESRLGRDYRTVSELRSS